MPKSAVTVSHALGQQEAVLRLKSFLSKMRADFGDQISDLEESWEANVLAFRFTTYGLAIAGDLTVEESTARFDARLPLAAMIMKGKIESSVRQELEKLLA